MRKHWWQQIDVIKGIKMKHVLHPIHPVFDGNSKILILGSFPSVKSREQVFFYGHPQNRFWKVLSLIFEEYCPDTIDKKHAFLLRNGIAVWDVIGECSIEGSSDASIKDVKPNDLNEILDNAVIDRIFVNGRTAEKMYNKYIEKTVMRPAVCLPSTSPANAAWSLDRLVEAWSVIKSD